MKKELDSLFFFYPLFWHSAERERERECGKLHNKTLNEISLAMLSRELRRINDAKRYFLNPYDFQRQVNPLWDFSIVLSWSLLRDKTMTFIKYFHVSSHENYNAAKM
jgi:hypothetical protein